MLPAYLVDHCGWKTKQALQDYPPLDFSPVEGKALASYKEKWSPLNCVRSLQTTGLYEAGGGGGERGWGT